MKAKIVLDRSRLLTCKGEVNLTAMVANAKLNKDFGA
jgi:hypothetical protein